MSFRSLVLPLLLVSCFAACSNQPNGSDGGIASAVNVTGSLFGASPLLAVVHEGTLTSVNGQTVSVPMLTVSLKDSTFGTNLGCSDERLQDGSLKTWLALQLLGAGNPVDGNFKLVPGPASNANEGVLCSYVYSSGVGLDNKPLPLCATQGSAVISNNVNGRVKGSFDAMFTLTDGGFESSSATFDVLNCSAQD